VRQIIHYFLLLALSFGSISSLTGQKSNNSTTTSKQVEVYFSVIDKDKNPILDLNRGDIELLEDGIAQQIATFDRQIDAPITMSILVDISFSLEPRIPAEKTTALSLLNSILRPGKDSALVATFTNSVNVEQMFTGDLKRLQSAVDNIKFVTAPRDARGNPILVNNQEGVGSTAIWDAVWIMCEHILPQGPSDSRNIIVLLSDGDDTISQKRLDEAVGRALRSNAVVYLLRLREKQDMLPRNFPPSVEMLRANSLEEKALRHLTVDTGGRAFTPKNEAELQAAIAQTAQEVHHQYKITFTPKNSKSSNPYRKLEIRIVNPDRKKTKTDVAYPHGYFWSPQ
jgi:VWFA-related protein